MDVKYYEDSAICQLETKLIFSFHFNELICLTIRKFTNRYVKLYLFKRQIWLTLVTATLQWWHGALKDQIESYLSLFTNISLLTYNFVTVSHHWTRSIIMKTKVESKCKLALTSNFTKHMLRTIDRYGEFYHTQQLKFQRCKKYFVASVHL